MGSITKRYLTKSELKFIESELKAKGYMLTRKRDPIQLNPYEYLTKEFTGTEHSPTDSVRHKVVDR